MIIATTKNTIPRPSITSENSFTRILKRSLPNFIKPYTAYPRATKIIRVNPTTASRVVKLLVPKLWRGVNRLFNTSSTSVPNHFTKKDFMSRNYLKRFSFLN